MLKIKDNVDLKELEKFGFKPKYDEDTGEVVKYYMSTESKYKFDIEKLGFKPSFSLKEILKRILFIEHNWIDGWVIRAKNYGAFTDINVDIIYDLIKANMVEKVEE